MLLETDKIIIGQKLKQYRLNKKLTQFQLAEMANLNCKQISRIEAGINYPTYLTFIKLLEVLDIDIKSFEKDSEHTNDTSIEELMKLFKNSSSTELKIYIDVIKSIKKNLKKTKF